MKNSYGWVIVGVGALMTCVAIGATFSLAVYLQPMSVDTGWSRAGISSAMTLDFLTMGVAGFGWGAASDRYGTRLVVLIGAVLLQKSEGGGLGMGGGAGFMSSRGTANLLTRTTAILAVGFFITSLLLSWLASFDRKPTSIIGSEPASQTQPGGATPVAPPTSGGVLDTLKKADEQQNRAPAEPATPTAPVAK